MIDLLSERFSLGIFILFCCFVVVVVVIVVVVLVLLLILLVAVLVVNGTMRLLVSVGNESNADNCLRGAQDVVVELFLELELALEIVPNELPDVPVFAVVVVTAEETGSNCG